MFAQDIDTCVSKFEAAKWISSKVIGMDVEKVGQ